MIGLTRIYLGVHWLTDVLAGWSLGSAWALLFWLFEWAWQRRTGDPRASNGAAVSGTAPDGGASG